MKNKITENELIFYDLKWDTEYFGVNCAKAILNEPITFDTWNDLKDKTTRYQFVSIENRNSEPINAQWIGKETNAFLADVNIQFKKKLEDKYEMPENVAIHSALKENEQIIEIAEFQFSKFTEDPELAKRGGDKVYHQWLINSFNETDKHYALYLNKQGGIDGFLLHSYSGNTCVIELIAVSKNAARGGIGTSLFKAIEHEAYKRGCKEIRVGTQVRNTRAINFYQKAGCKQVGCHQVYHLWNL